MLAINPNSSVYRLQTMMHSFKVIYSLTPKQVNAFMKSYEIYEADWDHGEAIRGKSKVDYQDVKQNILSWYEVMNQLCAVGEVEKMYIPPTMDATKNIINNQILFEERFCDAIRMKAGDKAFELGCGRGRVAAHLASRSGADITAINIDETQLQEAVAFAKKNNLEKQCHFMNADFNDLPFPFADNTFDCVYEIQALSLSRDLHKLFTELHRIMKPNGRISLLEWVRLPAYDPANPHHLALMKKVKPLIGAIGTPSPAEYESALRDAGFKIVVSEDPSLHQTQEPLIKQANHYFGKIFSFISFLVMIKVLPAHFVTIFDKLSQDVDALCEADRLGLVTMCYHIVAENKKS